MNAIQSIESAGQRASMLPPVQEAGGAAQPGFANLLTSSVTGLDDNITQAERTLAALSLGDDIPAHEVMIGMERARFSLQFAVEFRNRVVEAYSEITRMSV
jgi:flagellar hook-basal body complex protein FliE